MAEPSATRSVPWRVKYDGVCARCGRQLIKGTPAVWDRSTKTISCIECPDETVAARPSDSIELDAGVAGGSARREYDRRVARRADETRARWGDRMGRLVLKLSADPPSTRAWAVGATGEEKLARALADAPGIRILNDRKVPGTRANIDHLVVGPAGVFVVDAKHLQGRIAVRNRGPFWRSDPGLFVGRRDCSKLADGLTWQVEAVTKVLATSGVDPLPRITPVLCFVDGEWPLSRAPDEYRGVRLEGTRSIRKLLVAPIVLDSAQIENCWRTLARALPPK